jgi:hypothetical protein
MKRLTGAMIALALLAWVPSAFAVATYVGPVVYDQTSFITWDRVVDSSSVSVGTADVITSLPIVLNAPFNITSTDSVGPIVYLYRSAAGGATDTVFCLVECSYDGQNWNSTATMTGKLAPATSAVLVGAGLTCTLTCYPALPSATTWSSYGPVNAPHNTQIVPYLNGALAIRVKIKGNASAVAGSALGIVGKVIIPRYGLYLSNK